MKNTSISLASMMICNRPRHFGDRRILSASDAVWEPVSELSPEILPYISNEIGNRPPNYAGALQMLDAKLLDILKDFGHMACFRGVEGGFLRMLQVSPPVEVYEKIWSRLEFSGWDICSGNGWLSASAHGVYPIDPFDGQTMNALSFEVNSNGLFDELNDCVAVCAINNKEIPEHCPWAPVAVFIA